MTSRAELPEEATGLRRFNTLPDAQARESLLACLDVPAWADALLSARPYTDLDALLERADMAARKLAPREIDRALAAHPRIGERPAGTGTRARWSRGEQSGVGDDAGVLADLAEANRRYEERFGRVFLICATGLDAGQVLDAARARLGNDDETERRVVAGELRKIALLRLRKAVGS
ncbi:MULTISPECIES: 2-oxo-4-hydroxy-4-carboxy-5-ureidoimidazoline decarboxylase [unclassified Spirillospora]|uniref:2-oxo-4-hydroxy-4-carboxy-5-ureidoimidazoline decarboxylase n=1 Tax=unclassified Spirillospora TaxID=2642701 RepID=UPI0037201A34